MEGSDESGSEKETSFSEAEKLLTLELEVGYLSEVMASTIQDLQETKTEIENKFESLDKQLLLGETARAAELSLLVEQLRAENALLQNKLIVQEQQLELILQWKAQQELSSASSTISPPLAKHFPKAQEDSFSISPSLSERAHEQEGLTASSLAEAIRISTIPVHTLDSLDMAAVKAFLKKAERMRTQGGTRSLASMIMPTPARALQLEHQVDPKEFLQIPDTTMEEMLRSRFHATSGVLWNQMIENNRLTYSREYKEELFLQYVEAFTDTIKMAGPTHAPAEKNLIDLFRLGLGDNTFKLQVLRQSPKTLAEAIAVATTARKALAEQYQLAKALLPKTPSSSKKPEEKTPRSDNSEKRKTDDNAAKATVPNKEKDTGAKPDTRGKSEWRKPPPNTTMKDVQIKHFELINLSHLSVDTSASSPLHTEIVQVTDPLDLHFEKPSLEAIGLLDTGASANCIKASLMTLLILICVFQSRKRLLKWFKQ